MAFDRSVERFTDISLPRSVFQLATVLLPLAGWWWAMAKSTELSWGLTWLMAPVGGLLLVRVFILQHDLGHGTLLPGRALRDGVGLVLGVLTLTPYHYWRWTHALHHKDFNKLEHRHDVGYFLTLTVAEYRALSPRARLLYRLYRVPVLFIGAGAIFQFFIKHRFPWDTPREKRREWFSVWFTNVALIAGVAALSQVFGLGTVLKVQLPMWLCVTWVGVWLFYHQHTMAPGYLVPEQEWDLERACLEGSSYYRFPQPLRWFTGDIGLHHVHHFSPLIPNYRLEEARLANPKLAAVEPLTFRQSLAALSLKLWDEKEGRFVGFPEAPAAAPAREPLELEGTATE